LLAIYAASFIKNIFSYTSSLTLARMMALSSSRIRQMVFRRYLSFGKLYLDKVGTGRLHHILMHFSSEVSGQISAIHRALKQLLLLVTYLYLMVKISPLLTAVLIATGFLLNSCFQWLVTLIRNTSGRMARAQVELNQKVLNLLYCIPLIKSYSRERYEEDRFAEISQREIDLSYEMSNRFELQPCLEELMIMTAMVVIAGVIGYMAHRNSGFRIGDTFMLLYLVRASIPTFGALRTYRMTMARARGPLSSLNEMLDDRDKVFISQGEKPFAGLNREIRIENLSFSYSQKFGTLHRVSCVIPKGETTAIVGATGAGKSSLVRLLVRFYDCPPGTIRLDGEDIRDFTLPSLMSHIALVDQDVQLFNDTIRNNLVYGIDEPVTEDRLVEACRRARLLDFIHKLPQGFDTEVGDRGARLSGGEKQRLALARAFLKRCEILILDEATSSLDSKTENFIQEAIDEAMWGHTVIVITHRLSTLKHADNILVMERGTVVESGTLRELLDRRGRFFEYWDVQREGFQTDEAA
jgi:subfamily B ATP-binding cassette protein MsbA